MSQQQRPILIGIAGGSGCGKTYLSKKIRNEVGDEFVSVLSMDQYFVTRTPDEINPHHINFDHPAHLDFEIMIQQIEKLKQGGEILAPSYDFRTMIQKQAAIKIKPTPIILVEGLFILAEPVVHLMDLTVFLDVDPDQRLLGRILRDLAERESKIENIVDRYQRFVRPSYHVFVAPTKQNADVIVDFTYRRAFFTQLLIHLVQQFSVGVLDVEKFMRTVRDETYQVRIRPEEGAMPLAVNILELAKAYPDTICPPVFEHETEVGNLIIDSPVPYRET